MSRLIDNGEGLVLKGAEAVADADATGYIADPPGPSIAPPVVALPPEPAEQVDFTTYLQRIEAPFPVDINDESTGYAWASIDAPPEPLHPGCRIALARLTMDELGIARAMAAGELTSPQRYLNVTLWAIRITGTGVAYRRGRNEFVYRRPELYMTDEFLARANGLSVIMEHPEKATLDSQEFADRVVGSIVLPYLRPEEVEVWGIAKVYDDEANALMGAEQLSTSPTVVLKDTGSKSVTLENGEALLIEGEAALLDHVAICRVGVWDKAQEPAGVDRSGLTLPDSANDPEPPRLDPIKLNKALAGLTLLSVRLSNLAARRRA